MILENTKNATMPIIRLMLCFNATVPRLTPFWANKPSEADKNMTKPITVREMTENRKKRSMGLVGFEDIEDNVKVQMTNVKSNPKFKLFILTFVIDLSFEL